MEKYKGYIIEEETEPWAKKYELHVKYYPDGDASGESTKLASSISDAKNMIDEAEFTDDWCKR